MHLLHVDDFDHWRERARSQLIRGVPPHDLAFRSEKRGALLFSEPEQADQPDEARRAERLQRTRVPARFLNMARKVACHSRADRWDLMYRLLWRFNHGEPQLLEDATDEDVLSFHALERAVSREIHHMQAFVRFQKVVEQGEDFFVAWFHPAHPVLRLTADFFANRFASMNWCILTPCESLYWDQHKLRWGPGVPQKQLPATDRELEELWKTYYSATFNPARSRAQQRIPTRYWQTMPETSLIPQLVKHASDRTRLLVENIPPANTHVPATDRLDVLAEAARTCQACELCHRATQTVFGTGPASASLVLVGEQPGDEEDLAGRPFVGPAGKVLDEALAAAGLARDELYLTNAVKHFHWQPRGKRRLHQKPKTRHIVACQEWFEAEMKIVQPQVLVCLGVTAAQTVVGRKALATLARGSFAQTPACSCTLVTWHPAAILRAPKSDQAARFGELVEHLQLAKQQIAPP